MAMHGKNQVVRLVSSESGHRYTTTINPKNRLEKGKLELRKYDPTLRRVVVYKQAKANT